MNNLLILFLIATLISFFLGMYIMLRLIQRIPLSVRFGFASFEKQHSTNPKPKRRLLSCLFWMIVLVLSLWAFFSYNRPMKKRSLFHSMSIYLYPNQKYTVPFQDGRDSKADAKRLVPLETYPL